MDLSRKRLDWCALRPNGEEAASGATPPDLDGLARLVHRLGDADREIVAVVEAMNGARFVHDQLERAGWQVEIADARRVKGLAPLAAKTDRIDAWVLAELARLQLVPALWLPDPGVRAERERARFRLHLVKHRTMLKNRVHSTLIAHGYPCPVSDLFGGRGRELLGAMALPEPWQGTLEVTLGLIDELEREIEAIAVELRRSGADHPYVSLLRSAPGIGWILGYTIAAEIGEIRRFPTATKLVGYTGLCPRVDQSGDSDRRGPLAKNGPKYLRWALLEAAQSASRSPCYREVHRRTRARLGRQRGPKVAAIVVARKLAEAIWHMLTRGRPFAPAGVTPPCPV